MCAASAAPSAHAATAATLLRMRRDDELENSRRAREFGGFATDLRMPPESLSVEEQPLAAQHAPESRWPRGASEPQQAHSSIPAMLAAFSTGSSPAAPQPSEPVPQV